MTEPTAPPDELEEARAVQAADDDELFRDVGFLNKRKDVLEAVALLERAASVETLDAMVRSAERRARILEARADDAGDVDRILVDVRVFKLVIELRAGLEQIGKDAQARATIRDKIGRGHRKPKGRK